MKLKEDQNTIVKFASEGHNLLITGQAGVGKSEVVKTIIGTAKARGKKVAVICSSGIACQVYDRGEASTVHSYYGLSTAELPWRQVIDRSCENSLIRDRIKAIDVIIWDEASMSSQRMFELVNFLHHELATDDCKNLPFAGKQIILIGEFLQLQPVPNLFDEGHFMFFSPLFDFAVAHRFGLTVVMRQQDPAFLSAVSEIREGNCSLATEHFITSLQRELPWQLLQNATHIYFRKVPVQLENRRQLDAINEEMITFQADFENDRSRSMSWPGASILQLKRGCKVMLVWNKSDDLKNGTLGIFTGVKGNDLLVNFKEVGIVEIGRETWIKRDRNGQRIGSVTQFPIVLAYACTCHKSQGLTLPSAVVHCSREYVPGLIYVAISRVKSPEHIQVLNFNSRQLLKPQKKALDICSSKHVCQPVADLSCCRNKTINQANMLCVRDRYQDINQENEEPYTFPCDMLDGPVRACFEDDEVATPLELLDIFERLTRHESTLSSPPDEFFINSRTRLLSMKTELVVSPFQEQKNSMIDLMVNDACWISKVQPFLKLIWFHVFLLIENHIVENHEEIVVDIGRQGFTEVTGALHQFFNGNDFSRYVCVVFGVNESTPPQRAVAIQLATFVYYGFLEHLNCIVREEATSEPVIFDVGEMTEVGRSKVRHVGGWAVRKVLSRARKYVQRNVHTNSSSTLAIVESQQRACELLEENIIQPFDQLEESSKFPESLQVTEERQYRQRGLLHISDDAYVFFLSLEQRRVDLLNFQVLKKAREDMVEAAVDSLSSEETLKERWRKCFPEEDANKSKVMNIAR